jgi:hypothetical protein
MYAPLRYAFAYLQLYLPYRAVAGRNSLIANAISSTCVSSAKCRVSRILSSRVWVVPPVSLCTCGNKGILEESPLEELGDQFEVKVFGRWA